MNTLFTPGPWKPHATGMARSGVPEFEIHWSDIGECVAEIVHGDANAHLIAAAPDLYEALDTIENDAGQVPDWLWDRIQSVLAKARGEVAA